MTFHGLGGDDDRIHKYFVVTLALQLYTYIPASNPRYRFLRKRPRLLAVTSSTTNNCNDSVRKELLKGLRVERPINNLRKQCVFTMYMDLGTKNNFRVLH